MENFQFRNTDLNNIEVGCTKGSVKKYLAALHANVNESNGSVSNEEKFLDNKVLVFDPPIGLEDYLEKLAPILMSMDILWFDGQPLKKGREIGKNVYQRNSTFKYFLFDRKRPRQNIFHHNWVMSALPNDKELEKYQKGGNETAQQFNNSEKIDGWGFVNNFKDIIGFDPFNQLNESEEEFDWVPREVDLNNPEVLFTVIDNVLKNTNFKIVKSTNPFSIGGVTYHIEDEYGDTYIYINEQDFNLPFIYHDIRDNLSFLTAEEDNELIPYYKKLLRLIQPLYNNNKDILFKPINESEFDDLEWAEDAISGLDHYEEWDGKTELNDDTFLMINGEWDGLDFHNQPAKIVRVSDPEEHSYLLAFPQVIDAYEQNTHCGNIEDFRDDEYKCHCEDTDSQRGRCWYVPLGELSEVKIFPNRKGFLGESEEDDLGWAEELVNNYDLLLTNKAWEIILPGDYQSFLDAQDWAFSKGFGWRKGRGVEKTHLERREYNMYSAICSLGSVFDYNITANSMTYSGAHKCNLENQKNDMIRIAKDHSRRDELYLFKWDSSKKEAVISEIVPLKNINESEGDDLEWAEDMVNTNPTYRFGDLVFKPHHIPGAVRARLNFPNGHYISVVGGPHLYGDGVNTFEIWGSDADEPEGYLSKDEVTNRMLDLQELPPLEGEGSFKKGPVTESEEEEFDWIKDIEGNEYWVNFDQISKGDYVMYKKGVAIQEPKDGGFWQVVGFRECLTYNPMDWSTVKMPCVDLQSVKDAKGQRWLTGENITVTDKPEEFRAYPIKFRILDKVDWLRNRGWRVPLKGNWHLNDLNLKLDESENKKSLLTEGRYDAITRQAVKDIMNVVIQTRGRNDELHQAVLPNAMREDEFEYSQEGLSFSIELNVHHQNIYETRPADKESDAYFVHTAIADDEENIIMMTVVVDPTWEPKIYEKLFYKLQEDIRHEIEHFTQMGPNRIPDRPTSRTDTANLKTVYGHHKNKIEVPALVHGFYRRAKLEKRPLDDIMIEDLDSEIERGNLSSKQAQKLLQIWVDYAKKNLPKAKYST